MNVRKSLLLTVLFFLPHVTSAQTAGESAVAQKAPDKVESAIPENCAFFSGGWAGRYSQHVGPIRLWVTEILADCSLKYSSETTSSNEPPAKFSAGQVKDGQLTVPCGMNGMCSFKREGDRLFASYSDRFGFRNNGVFERIPSK